MQRDSERPNTDTDPEHSPTERSIPVVDERLVVDKRLVELPRGVRVTKSIRHDVVPFDQPLEVDELVVERVAVGRIVDGPVDVRQSGDTLIVPVVEERLVTRVERVLVEELHITRRSRTVHERGEVTLRREQVAVERFDETSDGEAATE